MIIKISYLLIKHLCHRYILFEVNVEFYLFNNNFALSNFLDVCHDKQRRFLYTNSVRTVPNTFYT
jgi:hypothetical protein